MSKLLEFHIRPFFVSETLALVLFCFLFQAEISCQVRLGMFAEFRGSKVGLVNTISLWLFLMVWVHPGKLTCPPKRDYFNRKYIETNHQFSRNMLVFWECKWHQPKPNQLGVYGPDMGNLIFSTVDSDEREARKYRTFWSKNSWAIPQDGPGIVVIGVFNPYIPIPSLKLT